MAADLSFLKPLLIWEERNVYVDIRTNVGEYCCVTGHFLLTISQQDKPAPQGIQSILHLFYIGHSKTSNVIVYAS